MRNVCEVVCVWFVVGWFVEVMWLVLVGFVLGIGWIFRFWWVIFIIFCYVIVGSVLLVMLFIEVELLLLY